MIKSVSILGNGNVGAYLAKAFRQMGIAVSVYSRHPKAQELAWESLDGQADLCLLCIPDRFIAEVSAQIPVQSGIVAHTSGTVSLEAIDVKHQQRGIFYPLMSLRADSSVEVQQIPFCLEASRPEVYTELETFAKSHSLLHYPLDSEKRKHLHLAAVISHNFGNYLYHWAHSTLAEVDLPLPILKPLLLQQIQGLDESDPILKQTGPAVRKDKNTQEAHQELLKNPELAALYRQISSLILKEHEEKL